MVREVRETRSKPSSGKHSASNSEIHKLTKEKRSLKAPFCELTSFEQLLIASFSTFDGKPLSGNDSSLGQ